MNLLDVIAVGLAAAAAVIGFRLGFVTRVVSWIGLGLGLLLAVRVLPWLLGLMTGAGPAEVLLVAVLLVFLGAFAGQGIGYVIGHRLQPHHADGSASRVDRGLGAVAGVAGVIVALWLLLPILADTPGWVARQASTSFIAQQIDDRLPEAPDAVQALRSLVGEDRFPDVFAALRPTPELGPPPAESGLSDATAAQVARSVVKVEGTACRRVQDGTGFVASPGVIVTNAHVVAGESSTEVVRDDGKRLRAQVVAFDPGRDLALLRVDQIDRPALPIATASAGDRGGVFGHPGGNPLRIAPFSVARELRATGRDIYATSTTERDVLELASALQPGDSGSALVDPGGRVVGVAFAVAKDRPGVAYALATTEVRTVLGTASNAPVPTGSCLG